MPSDHVIKITLSKNGCCVYTTNDLIQGEVHVELERVTSMDDWSIKLEGKASTLVKKPALLSARRIFGDHRFLKISHPIRPTEPNNQPSLQRQNYLIPFEFAVPEALLPYACSHTTADEGAIREEHLLLPPSLGGPCPDCVLIDDAGPKGAKVEYSIHVKARKYFSDGTSIVLKKTRPVHIIPRRHEDSPLYLETDNPYYRLSHEQGVCRGLPTLGGPTGRLIAKTSKLPSLKIPVPVPDQSAVNDSTLRASVDLRFIPAFQEEPPPRLDSITLNLHSFTFYGASPYEAIPKPDDFQQECAEHVQHKKTYKLGNYCLRHAAWTRHAVTASQAEPKQDFVSPEDPIMSTISRPLSVEDNQLPSYTSLLQLPIQLPQDASKQSNQAMLTPTFSSCIISRTYSVEMILSYKTRPASSDHQPSKYIAQRLSPTSHLILRVPLQIQVGSTSPSSLDELVSQDERGCGRERGRRDDWLEDLALDGQPPAYTPVS